ncbi:MAG TPA: flagellar basal body-associated FliL family protein [Clostridia bacterium]|nr:flagellar basal body-associated FliL family protein [Clostridia bacterium]
MNLGKIILYMLIGFIISAAIFGTLFYFFNSKQKGEIAVSYKTYQYDVGEFSTNLGSTRNYFKGTIKLETLDKKLFRKLGEKDTEIRDCIITTLIGKKAEEILEPEGQLKLKNEILKVITDAVGSDRITSIYFTDYIVQ